MSTHDSSEEIPASVAAYPNTKAIHWSREQYPTVYRSGDSDLDHASSKMSLDPSFKHRRLFCDVSSSTSSESSRNGYHDYTTGLEAGKSQMLDTHDDRLAEEDDQDQDPRALMIPSEHVRRKNQPLDLESQSLSLVSELHLRVILNDVTFLQDFALFIKSQRKQSASTLQHYLDCLKALKALHFANAVIREFENLDTHNKQAPIPDTSNSALLRRANSLFEHLLKEELPAFITHGFVEVAGAAITTRISRGLVPYMSVINEDLAEVFCLTDPRRVGNPIVFASEGFHRMTQHGLDYILGRNCRFLQGPHTNALSVSRLREAISAGRHHQEVFLNYRRDGTHFLNLLMIAPLLDSQGSLRYFIGAQTDISALLKDDAALPSVSRLLKLQSANEDIPEHHTPASNKIYALRHSSDSLSKDEISILMSSEESRLRLDPEGVRHTKQQYSTATGKFRVTIYDTGSETLTHVDQSHDLQDTKSIPVGVDMSGKLSGVFQDYLLVRPYPSLRILFASPSQRIPGILQSPFMDRIGVSENVHDEIKAGFAAGRAMTAKIRWLKKSDQRGRTRWIHCTPLIGIGRQVGVWMVVIVADEPAQGHDSSQLHCDSRRPERRAPPIMTGLSGAALHGLKMAEILPFETPSDRCGHATTSLTPTRIVPSSSDVDMPQRIRDIEWNVSRDFADRLIMGEATGCEEPLRQKAKQIDSRGNSTFLPSNNSYSNFSI